jgi:osmotically-inducible protein OsmY
MTQNQNRTDTQLKSSVIAELAWTPSVNETHIGVAVADGVVTLSGQADSYPEKILAERAALRVRGVNAVAEEITVRNTFGAVSDTTLASEAMKALAQAIDVPVDSVQVTVHNHVVHLAGTVSWQFQRVAAGRAVRYLKGVSNVSNSVIVKPIASAMGVHAAIDAALVRNAEFEGKNITVTSDDAGTVTLSGKVHSWAERRQTEQTAWSAPGVTAVKNHLQINH